MNLSLSKTLGVVLIAGLLLAWMVTYVLERQAKPVGPLEYTLDPAPVANHDAVHPGEALDLQVGRCNNTGAVLRYDVTREIVEAETGIPSQQQMPAVRNVEMRPSPRCETIHSPVVHVIPRDLPPGEYRIRFTATVLDGANPPHLATFSTEPFRVVAR